MYVSTVPKLPSATPLQLTTIIIPTAQADTSSIVPTPMTYITTPMPILTIITLTKSALVAMPSTTIYPETSTIPPASLDVQQPSQTKDNKEGENSK